MQADFLRTATVRGLLRAREDRRPFQQKHFAVPFARAAARAPLSLAQTLSYRKSFQPGVHNPSIEDESDSLFYQQTLELVSRFSGDDAWRSRPT